MLRLLFSGISSLFGGSGGLFSLLQKAEADYLAAQTDAGKQAAKVNADNLRALIESQQAAVSVRKATSGQWEMRALVFLAGLGPTLHYLCVCMVSTWPIYFKGWTVLALPPPMDQWEGSIILSFFGLSAIRSGVSAMAWLRR